MNAATLRKRLGRQKGQCTWCGAPVMRGRSTWCSQACVESFRLAHDWPYIRRHVHKRDRGVCALCGADGEKIQRIARLVRHGPDGWESYQLLRAHYRSLGYDEIMVGTLWEADHILPRVLGGGNELSNLRTLCRPCHKRETARLAAERAAARRAANRGNGERWRQLSLIAPEGP